MTATSGSLIAICDSIIKQLENGDGRGVPPVIGKIVGELETDEIAEREPRKRDVEDVKDTEVYFPLDYNAEQERILKTLDRQDGVLVQGPPGTGKS